MTAYQRGYNLGLAAGVIQPKPYIYGDAYDRALRAAALESFPRDTGSSALDFIDWIAGYFDGYLAASGKLMYGEEGWNGI